MAHVRGRVQGVGFRWWTRCRARELGLVGTAANLPDGRVQVVAEGAADSCRALLELLAGPSSRGRPGEVSGVTSSWGGPQLPLPGTAGDVGFTEA